VKQENLVLSNELIEVQSQWKIWKAADILSVSASSEQEAKIKNSFWRHSHNGFKVPITNESMHPSLNICEKKLQFEQNANFLRSLENFENCHHFGPLFALVSSWFGSSCDILCSGTWDINLALLSLEIKWHSFQPLVENATKIHCSEMT